MKHYISITILFLFISLSIEGQIQENDIYRINGKIDQQYNGKYINLNKLRNDSVISTDQSQINEGRFTFEGEAYPGYMSQLVFELIEQSGKSLTANLVLEKGQIEIQIDTTSRVGGTPLNILYQIYQDSCSHYINRLRKYVEIKKMTFGEGIHIKIAKNTPEDIVFKQFGRFLVEFKKQNLSNAVGLFAFLDDLQFRAEAGAALKREATRQDMHYLSFLELATTTLKQPQAAIAIEELQKKKEQLSTQEAGENKKSYTDFPLRTYSGKKVRLSDYVGKSELLVVEFTASWCSVCIASIPHLKKIYEKYHPKGVDFISISQDTEKESWKRLIDRVQAPWPELSDLKGRESDLAKAYGINGLPQIIIIDKSGTVLEENQNVIGLPWLLDLYLHKNKE